MIRKYKAMRAFKFGIVTSLIIAGLSWVIQEPNHIVTTWFEIDLEENGL